MVDNTLDPQMIAREVAVEVANDPQEVGSFVTSVEIAENVTDFRFACLKLGYEGWQWSVTLFHDVELELWTVNESSLLPTEEALLAPEWVPWKDRLEPSDLSVTDAIGTEPDDPRMETGFVGIEGSSVSLEQSQGEEIPQPAKTVGTQPSDTAENTMAEGSKKLENNSVEANPTVEISAFLPTHTVGAETASTTADADVEQAVETFRLSRRHVMSPLGRSQAAQRWYEGPHGPKSLSTKIADGNICSTCGFFIPLQGELNIMFGVCANKWSPDDGRVVSLDHGCGEHSEIEPIEPSRLWVQSQPAFDDLHIDVVAQGEREERAEVELLEESDENFSQEDIADISELNEPLTVQQGTAESGTVREGTTEEITAESQVSNVVDEQESNISSEAVSSETVSSKPQTEDLTQRVEEIASGPVIQVEDSNMPRSVEKHNTQTQQPDDDHSLGQDSQSTVNSSANPHADESGESTAISGHTERDQ